MSTTEASAVAFLTGRARAMHAEIKKIMDTDWPLVKKVEHSHTAMLEFLVMVEYSLNNELPESPVLKDMLAEVTAMADRTWKHYQALLPPEKRFVKDRQVVPTTCVTIH